MKVSVHGMLSGIELSLRSSQDDHACMYAFSVMELGDNLRALARGDCTIEEFFSTYKVDVNDKTSWANSVDKAKYDCMQGEEEDVD
jgi:hypothetical protein